MFSAILQGIMTTTQHFFNQAKAQKRKKLAVLIDPDKVDNERLKNLSDKINTAGVDMILVGGSLMIHHNFGNQNKLINGLQ